MSVNEVIVFYAPVKFFFTYIQVISYEMVGESGVFMKIKPSIYLKQTDHLPHYLSFITQDVTLWSTAYPHRSFIISGVYISTVKPYYNALS